jgi:hypothetical protein
MITSAIGVFLAIVSPIGLIPLASSSTPLSKQAPCDPIGRMIEGTSANFNRGQVVCAGDLISSPNEVVFLCFSHAALIPLSGRSVLINQEACSQRVAANTAPPARACDRTGISRLLCLVPKGPEEQFQLLEPDVISSNPRPTISWEAVSGADAYAVKVIGPDIDWEVQVNAQDSELPYPAAQPSLTAGNAYEVLVVADRDTPIVASKIVNIQSGGNPALSLRPR